MEKRIVIATTNVDKFSVVKDLLVEMGLTNYEFRMLDAYPEYLSPEEIGTVNERSRQKVTHFLNFLKQQQIEEPEIIVGVDDGFRKEGDTEVLANSEVITERILAGEYLQIGEVLFVVRSFSFFLKKPHALIHALTEIPFQYIDGHFQAETTAKKYPLNHVLALKDHSVPVVEEHPDTAKSYNLLYSTALRLSVLEILRSS